MNLARNTGALVGRSHFVAARKRVEFDEEESVALKAAAKRQIKRAARFLLEKVVTRRRNDADNLNGFARLDIAFSTLLDADSRTAVIFPAWRIVVRILDPLAERVAIRPKFFRERVVDNRNRWSTILRRFGGGEGAAAQQRQTDRREIIRADAVPGGVKREAVGGGCRLGLRRGIDPGALHRFAERNHPERNRGRNARMFDSGERG